MPSDALFYPTRQLSMNKDWIKIQNKAYVRWINIQFETSSNPKVSELRISDLSKDLSDGVVLNYLMGEITQGAYRESFNTNPKSKIKQLDNIGTVINYLNKNNVQLHNIDAQDIYEGNLKLVFGLIWALILNYTLKTVNADAGISTTSTTSTTTSTPSMTYSDIKRTLLSWVQSTVSEFQLVSVVNFTTSWNNGVALCALLGALRPELLDFYMLDLTRAEANTKKALDLATSLGVPRLLDCEDLLAETPDEKAVVTYLIGWYEKFHTGSNKNKLAPPPNVTKTHKRTNTIKRLLKPNSQKPFSSFMKKHKNESSESIVSTPETHFMGSPAPNVEKSLFSATEHSAASFLSLANNDNSPVPNAFVQRQLDRQRIQEISGVQEISQIQEQSLQPSMEMVVTNRKITAYGDTSASPAAQQAKAVAASAQRHDDGHHDYRRETSQQQQQQQQQEQEPQSHEFAQPKPTENAFRSALLNVTRVIALKRDYEAGVEQFVDEVAKHIGRWTSEASFELCDLEELTYEKNFIATTFQETKLELLKEKTKLKLFEIQIENALASAGGKFVPSVDLDAEWRNLYREEVRYLQLVETKTKYLQESLLANYVDTLKVLNKKYYSLEKLVKSLNSENRASVEKEFKSMERLLINVRDLHKRCARNGIQSFLTLAHETVDSMPVLEYSHLYLEIQALKTCLQERISIIKEGQTPHSDQLKTVATVIGETAQSSEYITKKELRTLIYDQSFDKVQCRKLESQIPIHENRLGYNYKALIETYQNAFYNAPVGAVVDSANSQLSTPKCDSSASSLYDESASSNVSSPAFVPGSKFSSPVTFYDAAGAEAVLKFPSNFKVIEHGKFTVPLSLKVMVEQQL